MPSTGYSHSFRMKQLPKTEYTVMRRLIEQYKLDDPSELFTALLRLTAEVDQLRDATVSDGSQWLTRIIAEVRTTQRHTAALAPAHTAQLALL